MSAQHTPTLKQGPSGIRAECSCGWGGKPRYTDRQAYDEHARHVDEDDDPEWPGIDAWLREAYDPTFTMIIAAHIGRSTDERIDNGSR